MSENILPQGLRSVLKEVFRTRFWVIFSFSVFFFLGSVILEHRIAFDLLNSKSEFMTVEAFNEHKTIRLWASLSKEIAFALFISLVLIIFVENASKTEQKEFAEEFTEKISQDVFGAMLGRNMPKPVVAQAVGILNGDVVRKNMKQDIVIDEIPSDELTEDEGAIELPKAIKMRVSIDYDIQNTSPSSLEHEFRLVIPLTRFRDLRHLVKLECVSINNDPMSDEDIARSIVTENKSNTESSYAWIRTIENGGLVNFSATYILIKELSDNELWTNLLPTLDSSVNVSMNLKETEWNVDALHSGKLKPVRTKNTKNEGPFTNEQISFKADSVILPYQGYNLWWRPKDPYDVDSPQADNDHRLTDGKKVIDFN